ncbi:MAG: acetyl-CoA carboxylase, carboxyltransferase subunit beta [Pseudomonadota bacterium]
MALPERTPTQSTSTEKRSVGQGLFRKCTGCGVVNTVEDLTTRFYVCPSCGYHHPMASADWRKLVLDDAQLDRWDEHILPADPLEFEDGKRYVDRISRAQAMTGATEAIEIGRARISGIPIAYGAYNFAFMGGSMGSVVGERITRLFERATSERLPVVLLHASGGARMQEGILSLMQMAKTMSALGRFRSVKKPYISVLLHPTTGGVAASTAFLGDVNVVEPNATIGFAGPRVIESTINAKLPAGFQRSEFLLDHGMVDTIAPRNEMKQRLHTLLSLLIGEGT